MAYFIGVHPGLTNRVFKQKNYARFHRRSIFGRNDLYVLYSYELNYLVVEKGRTNYLRKLDTTFMPGFPTPRKTRKFQTFKAV